VNSSCRYWHNLQENRRADNLFTEIKKNPLLTCKRNIIWNVVPWIHFRPRTKMGL